MRSRQEKIEARKRGAASRQISASKLVLGSPQTPFRARHTSKPATPRVLNTLNSAFNNDISSSTRGTPRHRNQHATTPLSIRKLDSAFNEASSAGTRREVRSPKQVYLPPERTPRRVNHHSAPKGKENVSPDVISKKIMPEVPAKPERDISTVRRKRKSHAKTPKAVPKRRSIPATPELRKSKRPHKPITTVHYSDVEDEPDISDSDSDYNGEPNVPSVAPTPVVKAKRKPAVKANKATNKKAKTDAEQPEATKMIEVKLERLSYTPKHLAVKTISPLDVLSQIMGEYLSASQPTRSSQLDKKVLKKYSTLVGDHFTTLIDISLNNENLSKELLRSNKRKEELRSKIYDIRKKHDELAVNLERARRSYQFKKKKYEANRLVSNSLKRLKGEFVHEINVIDPQDSTLADKVELDLAKLNKIINPESGIVNKFESLNRTLEKLDEKL